MPTLGAPELIILLLIVIILFGASRMADLGKSLGQGIREFRKATREDDDRAAAPAAGDGFCPQCGTSRTSAQRFCTRCGTAFESSPARPEETGKTVS